MNERERGMIHRSKRSLVVCLLLALTFGAFLPALMPATSGSQSPPRSLLLSTIDVFFCVDTYLLPAGTSDAIRIPVNTATSLLWGVVIWCLWIVAQPARQF